MSAHTPEETTWENADAAAQGVYVDEASAESFPASDPPAATPIIGVGAPGAPVDGAQGRAEMSQPGQPPKEHEDELVDEAIDESFPASDPPSTTPLTGVGKTPGPDGEPPRGAGAPGPDGEPARSSSNDERDRGRDQPVG